MHTHMHTHMQTNTHMHIQEHTHKHTQNTERERERDLVEHLKEALFEVSHFLQGILVALHCRHGELCRDYETMPAKTSLVNYYVHRKLLFT
jgi:hypothetical protein